MLNMFAAMAQFEREIMLERQREGIAKAKADGKYKEPKPTARAKAEDVVQLFSRWKTSSTHRQSSEGSAAEVFTEPFSLPGLLREPSYRWLAGTNLRADDHLSRRFHTYCGMVVGELRERYVRCPQTVFR
jgi:hypothetical protein